MKCLKIKENSWPSVTTKKKKIENDSHMAQEAHLWYTNAHQCMNIVLDINGRIFSSNLSLSWRLKLYWFRFFWNQQRHFFRDNNICRRCSWKFLIFNPFKGSSRWGSKHMKHKCVHNYCTNLPCMQTQVMVNNLQHKLQNNRNTKHMLNEIKEAFNNITI